MIIVAHPTGAVNAREAATGFARHGLLDRFYVSLNINAAHPVLRRLPERLLRHLRRRNFDLPQHLIRSFPLLETLSLACERLPVGPLKAFSRHYRSKLMNDHFDRRMARALEHEASEVFYGFVHSSDETTIVARSRRMLVVTEMTTPDIRFELNLMRAETRLQQAWSATMDDALANDPEDHGKRQEAVISRSDLVIVPSTFVASTLPKELASKVLVANYGYTDCADAAQWSGAGSPLKVLFVGGLSQRKGLSYLAEALDRVPAGVELTLIGGGGDAACPALDALKARARWIKTLPNPEVRAQMRAHDVLVLPSLSDAFGLVVMEALSQGTTVIVSENTGAKDLVVDGENGFIIPIRDAAALADRIGRLAEDRALLGRMSQAALDRARREQGRLHTDDIVQAIRQRLAEKAA